jgi:hypothetical protein
VLLEGEVIMEASATETKPPYGGFRAFWRFIEQLGEYPHLPQVLDRSVMGNRGGTARSELYTALRFFDLIDDEKKPTAALQTLVGDPSTARLRQLLETKYQPVIALNLHSATPRQLDEALSAMGVGGGTVSKARAFFLTAAEEAGIEFGRLLKTSRAPSSGPRRRTGRKKPAAEPERPPSPPKPDRPPVISALVEKLPSADDGWSETEARQWLSLVAPAIAYDYGLDLTKLVSDIKAGP